MIRGLLAGAVGTVALNIATYVDMAVRGRPPSDLPSEVVRALAERLGLSYLATPPGESDQHLKQRRSGLGALSGFGVGLGVGAVAGLARPLLGRMPFPIAAIFLGAVAMAASDVPATRLGVTDPGTWETADWISDAVPHLAYGTFTALALRCFGADEPA